MSCYYPVPAWKAKRLNESGKRGVVFNPRDGFLDQPLDLPCGKCVGCRADQALMWSIRAYHESTLHDQNSFLTLTYSDGNLPLDGKIVKDDLQRFFKRLRKDGTKLRYIACGEYGDTTKRPHYHAVIFGQDFLAGKISITDDLYTQQYLVDRWGLGHVTIAPVTMASICYVCGYTLKKAGDPDTFSLMSRRPGIGHDWLKRYISDLQRTGTVTIEGREYPIPRRYLEWQPEEFERVKKNRAQHARDHPVDREALIHREVNRKSLISQKKEKL